MVELLPLLVRGSVELSLALTALGVVGLRVARAVGAEGALHVALHAFAAGLVALLGLELLLLWLGWLSGASLVLSCLALAVAVRGVTGSTPAAAKGAPRAPSWLLGGATALALGLAVARTVRRLLLPPVAGDALAYHLPMAVQWVQQGTLMAQDARVWFYPGNAELVLAGFMVPFGADFLVNLPDALTWGLTALAVAGILVQLGQPSRTAGLAGLVVVTCPLFVRTLARCGSDLFVATTFLLVVYFVVRATTSPQRTRGSLLLGACLLGVLCGTKYSAVTEAVLLGLFAVAVSGRDVWRMIGWRGSVFAALAVLWLGGSYYVRNLLLTGNPVYPLGFDIGLWSAPPGDHSLIIATATGIQPETLAQTSILRSERWQGALRLAGLHAWRLAGPLLLLPLLAGIGARTGERPAHAATGRMRLALWALLPCLVLLFLATPFSAESVAGTLNQIGSGASLRYALPIFALLVIASLASTRLSPRLLDPLLALVVVVQVVRSVQLVPLSPIDVLAGTTAALPVVALGSRAMPLWIRGSAPRTALLVFAVCFAVLCALAPVQERRRVSVYAQAGQSGVVEWLEGAPPGITLMASIGTRAYPLLGRRFENRVIALGLTRSWEEWSDQIDRVRPDMIVVSRERDDPHSPTLGEFPAQEEGLRSDPARFQRVYGDASVRVYALRSRLPES